MAENTTNYQCPACTGPLRFDSATGKLVCDYCGSTYEVKEVEALYADKQKASDTAARQRPQQRIRYTRFCFCLFYDQNSALINQALLLVQNLLIAGVQILLAVLGILGLKLVGAAGDAVNIGFLPQAVQVGAVLVG